MKTDKFKTNKFAKKYKEEIKNTTKTFLKKNKEMIERIPLEDIIENANQVRSWNRSPISKTINLTYLFLAFIIGFSVCAIVLTPLVINFI